VAQGPRWHRRKAARPAEIVEAALEAFAERGFAAAKLEDVARRAGVSKAALYLYFETKEELFRAVARTAVAANLDAIEALVAAADLPFSELTPRLLEGAASLMGSDRVPAIARIVIGEARNFPDLARVWHDDVVARALRIVSGAVAHAQDRGEAIPGDPRLIAFSVIGPMLMGLLYREVFAEVAADAPDLAGLARSHAQAILHGLLAEPDPPQRRTT
jgi:AcrR family transcriptional regulator